MAPDWARAVRPLVLVLTAAAFGITIAFKADVDAQGGAYATGVLVLITSASVAVTLACRAAAQRKRMVAFGVVSVIFLYTTGANVVERPDGLKIGALFIAAILLVSLLSRLSRAFELRVTEVELDRTAELFLRDCARRSIRLVAREPSSSAGGRTRPTHGGEGAGDYREKYRQITVDNELSEGQDVIFVEITVTDASDFATKLDVQGVVRFGRYRVLTMESSTVPNALAALLLHIRDVSGRQPTVYLEWTEGNPVANYLRFLLFGAGEVAPVTREVLRRAEPDRSRRPHVHVA